MDLCHDYPTNYMWDNDGSGTTITTTINYYNDSIKLYLVNKQVLWLKISVQYIVTVTECQTTQQLIPVNDNLKLSLKLAVEVNDNLKLIRLFYKIYFYTDTYTQQFYFL